MPLDAILRPVGPEPPGTYWRRRGGLLLALLTALLLARACTGPDATPAGSVVGSGGPAGPASVSPAPAASAASAAPAATAPTVPPTPAGAGTPTAPAAASTVPSTAATPPASPAALCSALTVAAETDERVYPAGGRPRLSLVVTNLGREPCRADVGQPARELRVVSGADRIWSSDDCSPGGESSVRELAPGQRLVFTVPWSVSRSRPGCPTGLPKPGAGTYRVIGRLGQQLSAETVFTLR